jgi:GWxTD domain-containing protein
MKSWRQWVAVALCGGLLGGPGLTGSSAVLAQEKDKARKEQEKKEKARKEQQEKLKQEMGNVYKTWLKDEVPYIITDEERTAFLRLSTNEEREQFIEQFWLRRDPTPDTMENEEKEEHYHRIAYANERFASGIPGWKTDRGRIYIIWGPPDEIESHPSGGSYSRPWEEGGGQTSTFPFEKWRYRYLQDIGTDIILEFVDVSGSGEYRMTMDPSEKDALLYVPGAGLSEMEAMGLSSKVDRFTRTDGTRLPVAMGGGMPARMNVFDRMEVFYKVQRPPATTKYKDLEALVTSRIVRDQIQFDYRFDFLRVTGDSVLVPITVQIPNRQLTFQNKEGVQSAVMNLYARITTLGGRTVQTFEDVIARDVPESLFREQLRGSSIYQKAVPLRPGLYRLDVVIKDVNSGNVGTVNTALRVPRYEEATLASSTLILADVIERVPARQIGLGQFVLGASKVRPRLGASFTPADRMGVYLQVYNLKIDETSHKPSASIEYRITKDKQEVARFSETTEQMTSSGEQVTLEKLIALDRFEPGKYKLEIAVTDNHAKQTITPTAEFTIKAAEKFPEKTAAALK